MRNGNIERGERRDAERGMRKGDLRKLKLWWGKEKDVEREKWTERKRNTGRRRQRNRCIETE